MQDPETSDREWDAKIALSKKKFETAMAVSGAIKSAGRKRVITEEQYREWLQSKEDDEA